MLAVQAFVALLVVAVSMLMAYREADRRVEEITRTRVLHVARALAATDDVLQGLATTDPARSLRDLAERERRRTDTDFVVVMTTEGVRFTHPTQAEVGGRYRGSIDAARAGGEIVEDYEGTLGRSTRAVVPVIQDGSVRGLVAVGVRRTRVEEALRALLGDVLTWTAAVAVLSGLGTWFLAARVRRQTLGLGAQDLRRLHDHHEAVLHAVREGLVIVDEAGHLQVLNAEAARLLGLSSADVGRRVEDLGLSPSLTAMLVCGGRHVDEQHASSGRVLLVSSSQVRRHGRPVGTLTTLRDRTELEELTDRLGVADSLSQALHAQAHEAANRLHTVITLIEMGQPHEAVQFGTADLQATARRRDAVVEAFPDPAVAALVLGKTAQAAELGIDLVLDPEANLPTGRLSSYDAVTIVGNLLDNAMESLRGVPAQLERTITIDAQDDGTDLVLTVADTGPGLAESTTREAFRRGWSTKDSTGPGGRGIGLALVQQTATRLGGGVDVTAGPGAVFTVRIPASGPVPGLVPGPASEPVSGGAP